MNSKTYKWCAVPLCKNTTIKTPNKLFVYVSKKPVRDKWLTLARRDPATLQEKSTLYFCEDHFDMPNDMENYMRYHLMGSVSQVRMKPGCMPTKFACQQHLREHMKGTHRHQHLHDRRKQPNILAHTRNMKENKERVKRLKESVDHNIGENQQISLETNGKSNQAHTTRTKQSKANGTKVRLVNQVTSPLKPHQKSAPTPPFKKNRRVNSKTSKSRSEKRAPGPTGSSSAGTPVPEPGYPSKLIQDSNARLEDPLATAPPHTIDTNPQCRFCADFSKDCVDMTDQDRPYLARNKTALTISDLSVEVDFNDALPKTLCQACDRKLLEMFKFVKQVKEAQDSLINVRDYVIEVDTVVKNECESPTPDDNDDIESKDDIVDSLTVTDTVFVKPNKPIIKHKRKRVEGAKTHKKHKVTKDVESEEVDFIIIEIKEETAEFAEMVDTNETDIVEFDDTEMDTKPSELELQTLLKLMK